MVMDYVSVCLCVLGQVKPTTIFQLATTRYGLRVLEGGQPRLFKIKLMDSKRERMRFLYLSVLSFSPVDRKSVRSLASDDIFVLMSLCYETHNQLKTNYMYLKV